MAPGLRLQQKQSQSLVMTPKLAQSIKLLQMSHVDLLEFVNDNAYPDSAKAWHWDQK